MAESTELTQHSKRDSLAPVDEGGRIFSLKSYIPFWISSMVVIQLFIIGQSFMPPSGKLNILQALTVTLVSSIIIGFMFVINSHPGIKYGIPFVVQCRSAFGYYGARIAVLVRVLPAVFWYGIGSWIGADAMNYVSTTVLGWGNVWLYFIIFQILQTAIAYYGIKSIKWFDSALSFVILAFLVYIVIQIFSTGKVHLNSSWEASGSWGMPFWTAITASVGILITGAINNGDLARYLRKEPVQNWVGHFVGIVPMFIIMVGIGILSAAATGIWDPIRALVTLVPNTAVAVALMIFIVAAQFTSNLSLNIAPPALVLMEIFNIKWGLSVIVVGILGIITFPWLLLTSSAFNTFITFYSAFLGPLLGILIADFYLVRKRHFDLDRLYNSPVKFHILGFASLIVGGICGVIFLPISWIVGLPVSMVIYSIGYRIIPYYKRELAAHRVDEKAAVFE